MATPDDKPSKLPQVVPYEVGYAKPPVAHRFKPGQSGNPMGRPRGSSTKRSNSNERLAAVIERELARTITVRNGDETERLTLAEAFTRSLGLRALKGDNRAASIIASLWMRADTTRITTPADRELVVRWSDEGARPDVAYRDREKTGDGPDE